MTTDAALPQFAHISRAVRHGRSVYEGYQRGVTIGNRDRSQLITEDPIYKKAHAIGGGRAITFLPKRYNLFLLLKYFIGNIPKGDIVEFGSFRGGLAMMMASICQDLHPGMTVYALDTFEGMPTVDSDVDYIKAGWFNANVDYNEIVQYARDQKLDNLKFVKGLFENTAESVLRETNGVALVHIDCDIKSAVEYAYEVVQPFLVDGAYIIFDDANHWGFIGATEVVEELVIRRDDKRSEQVDPHFVFRHNLR